MKFKPLQDRVVVKRLEGDEKTSGGIIIPDPAKEKPSEKRIVLISTTLLSLSISFKFFPVI